MRCEEECAEDAKAGLSRIISTHVTGVEAAIAVARRVHSHPAALAHLHRRMALHSSPCGVANADPIVSVANASLKELVEAWLRYAPASGRCASCTPSHLSLGCRAVNRCASHPAEVVPAIGSQLGLLLHGVDLALHPGKSPCAGYEPCHKAAVLFFVLRTDGKEAKWRILKRFRAVGGLALTDLQAQNSVGTVFSKRHCDEAISLMRLAEKHTDTDTEANSAAREGEVDFQLVECLQCHYAAIDEAFSLSQ